MKLGYSPWGNGDSIYPFHQVFKEQARLDYTPVKDCDAILLWGGTDINPAYYNRPAHILNQYDPDSPRDQAEVSWMKDAVAHKVPIIGVCRGAQFICAFAGGNLVQHATGHGSTHDITVIVDGQEQVYQTSSSHHQMLYPFDMPADEYDIIGWSTETRSSRYEGYGIAKPPCEPEVVLFPKIRALGIQGHPEWQDTDEPFVQWCLEQVRHLVAPF